MMPWRAVSHLDTNANGKVTPEEWKSGISKLLRYWDRDMDGQWSRKELNTPARKESAGR